VSYFNLEEFFVKFNVPNTLEVSLNDLKSKLLYNPQDIKSLIELGVFEFLKCSDRENAVRSFRKAIQLDASNVDARFWLGFCFYRYYSDYEGAKKFLYEALRLDHHRSDCLSLIAFINWDKGGSLIDSLAVLEKAIQISPDWPLLRIESIYILLNLCRFDAAEQAIEKTYVLTQTIKTPENTMNHYYEDVITGRTWTNLAERLEKLKDILIQMKNRAEVTMQAGPRILDNTSIFHVNSMKS
jgi:tetratricopeptide (TPR) repeat protein